MMADKQRGGRRPRWPAAALGFALAVGAMNPGAAQGISQLEADRQAVFEQMLASPSNRDLLLQYARLSVQMRDYEAATATLERLLDQEPDNAAARLELAQSYFAMGAYDVAEYHLSLVAAARGLSAEDAALVGDFQDEAERRSAPQRLTGRISAGATSLSDGDETGSVARIDLTWRADLGNAQATDWVTRFSGSWFSAEDATRLSRDFLRLRTGPEFRLTGDAFGPRLNPYLQFTAIRDEDDRDLDEVLVGVAYQNPHSAQWTSFADLALGRAEDRDTNEEIDILDVEVGASFRPTAQTRLRLALQHRREEGDTDEEETTGAQLDMRYAFDPDFVPGDRRWTLGAHFLAQQIEYSGGMVREDDVTALGLSLRAFFTENAFVEARATRIDRNSNLAAFDAEETVMSLQLGWEF